MPVERAPAFQFYPKDFLSSSKVARMSLTEIGVYMLLLSHAWLNGGLPTEVTEIAKLVKVPVPRFVKMWQGALSECFEHQHGRLVNVRLEHERQKQADHREAQSQRGKASAAARSQRKANQTATVVEPALQPERNSSSAVSVLPSATNRTPRRTTINEDGPPMDVWFEDLKREYPPEAVSSGHLTMTAFMDAVVSQGTPLATFTVMMINLDNQKRGHQWRVKRMIPRLDRWLMDGLWEQQHEETPPSTLVTDKTVRTLTSAQAFAAGGSKS